MAEKNFVYAGPEPIEIDPNDIKSANDFLAELVELCKKYKLTIMGTGDYGLVIEKYTDGQYHRENEIMDCIWHVNPDGADRDV